MDAKAVLVAVGPLVVVHEAPAEVAADGDAFGDGAVELGEVVAEVHDTVSVVDVAVGGEDVGRRGAVLGDVDLLDVPELGGRAWGSSREPRGRPGARSSSCAGRRRVAGRREIGRLSVGADVERGVDVEADEIEGEPIAFMSAG